MAHSLDGTYTVHGMELAVNVSPCSWMYQNHGFQVQYKSADGRSWGTVQDKQRDQATATADDVLEMLSSALTSEPCETCGRTHLYNPGGNRGHLCDVCFVTKLTQEFDQEMAAERDRIAQLDKQMHRDGYTHRVDAWVHPVAGDDYQVSFYTKGKPADAEIKRLLVKEGSLVFNDYSSLKL